VGQAESLEPHAPGVVEVAGNHADCLPRDFRDRSGPDLRGYVIDEKDGDLMIGLPGRQDELGEIRIDGHFQVPLKLRYKISNANVFLSDLPISYYVGPIHSMISLVPETVQIWHLQTD
jgi:hypothetical protein